MPHRDTRIAAFVMAPSAVRWFGARRWADLVNCSEVVMRGASRRTPVVMQLLFSVSGFQAVVLLLVRLAPSPRTIDDTFKFQLASQGSEMFPYAMAYLQAR